jgi:hypothetical protein
MPRKRTATSTDQALIPAEMIERRIYMIRSQKVMLDRDLAELYGVSTGRLNEQVKRNRKRFPDDFMFRLSKVELENWTSQFAISNSSLKMGLRRPPYAFTEHGVAMLSSVLNSDRAIEVNIAIVRAFVRLREVIASHKDLARRMADLERQQKTQGEDIAAVFQAIQRLLEPPKKPTRRIGFQRPES